jgi:hypothetical protein
VGLRHEQLILKLRTLKEVIVSERTTYRGRSESTRRLKLGRRHGFEQDPEGTPIGVNGGLERRMPNDTGDAVLNSDRDVEARLVRRPGGRLQEVSAPIPPPPEPNDSDYEADPSSKTSR